MIRVPLWVFLGKVASRGEVASAPGRGTSTTRAGQSVMLAFIKRHPWIVALGVFALLTAAAAPVVAQLYSPMHILYDDITNTYNPLPGG